MALDFKVIKQDFWFYVWFVLGTFAGIVGFSHAIMFLIDEFPLWTYLALAVMVVVGLPAVIKASVNDKKCPETPKLNTKEALRKYTRKHVIPFVIGAGAITGVFLLEMSGIFSGDEVTGAIHVVPMAIYSAFGAIAAMIPGVSGSFVLVAFGIYVPIMDAVRQLPSINYVVLVPAAVGIIVGLVAGARLVLLCLRKWRLTVYAAIIGMVAASAVMLTISTIAYYA
jgi:putative membrane protein